MTFLNASSIASGRSSAPISRAMSMNRLDWAGSSWGVFGFLSFIALPSLVRTLNHDFIHRIVGCVHLFKGIWVHRKFTGYQFAGLFVQFPSNGGARAHRRRNLIAVKVGGAKDAAADYEARAENCEWGV